MIGRIILALPLLGGVSLAMAGTAPVWPSNLPETADEHHPQVQAFYKAQCAQWSKEHGKTEAERQKYVQWCVDAMAEAQPVGLEPDAPGDGDEG